MNEFRNRTTASPRYSVPGAVPASHRSSKIHVELSEASNGWIINVRDMMGAESSVTYVVKSTEELLGKLGAIIDENRGSEHHV